MTSGPCYGPCYTMLNIKRNKKLATLPHQV